MAQPAETQQVVAVPPEGGGEAAEAKPEAQKAFASTFLDRNSEFRLHFDRGAPQRFGRSSALPAGQLQL
jgi:hypothetical protein